MRHRLITLLRWVVENLAPLLLIVLVPINFVSVLRHDSMMTDREGRIAVLEHQVRELEAGKRGDRWKRLDDMKPWTDALRKANEGRVVVPDPEGF